MTSRFRQLPPAGAPLRLSDLREWTRRALASGDAVEALNGDLCRRTGVSRAFAMGSGRGALTVLLQALHALAPAGRDEVIVPSYTCYSVAASVVRAGLRVRVADVDPATLDYAPASLAAAEWTRVLAIVATNPYGLPSNLPALQRTAAAAGAFLIDDAAQSLGARVAGRPSGGWGHAGILSFDKGKTVPALRGGAIVTNDPAVAAAVEAAVRRLPAPRSSPVSVARALATAILSHPRLYWMPNGIPALGLGQTIYSTDFTLGRPEAVLAALAQTMLRRLEALTDGRRRHAAALTSALTGLTGVAVPRPLAGAEPAWLRFPLLVASADGRDRLLGRLSAAGLGASGSYPGAIVDIADARAALVNPGTPMPGGRHVARHILTLPTHPFVTPRDLEHAIAACRAAASLPLEAAS